MIQVHRGHRSAHRLEMHHTPLAGRLTHQGFHQPVDGVHFGLGRGLETESFQSLAGLRPDADGLDF